MSNHEQLKHLYLLRERYMSDGEAYSGVPSRYITLKEFKEYWDHMPKLAQSRNEHLWSIGWATTYGLPPVPPQRG